MDCPVCPCVDIPDDAQVCPSCGVDLKPLLRVRELGAAEYNEALRLAGVGATEAAISRAAAALALDDRLVPARVLLGKLLWNLGEAQAAQAQWQQALPLAGDNAELQALMASARQKLARQRRLRMAVPLGGLLVLALLALAAAMPFRAFGARLDQLTAQVEGDVIEAQAKIEGLSQQLAAYRASHSHTDEEFAGLGAQAAQRKQEAEALARELTAYQAAHSHSDAEVALMAEQIAQLRRQVELLSQK